MSRIFKAVDSPPKPTHLDGKVKVRFNDKLTTFTSLEGAREFAIIVSSQLGLEVIVFLGSQQAELYVNGEVMEEGTLDDILTLLASPV